MTEATIPTQPEWILPERVPLFPLPEQVLLPGLPTPFTLFEPRYCRLAAWLAELPSAQRWLAVPCLAGAWQHNYQAAPTLGR